ncbi:Wzz/FepE/Etk N-terminal domain-containing protein [Pseudarthrobacter sulfonivorans]|uniref:YveK family protein n=1 Tax=Pseudarthrobacter sulfonivorans TaxID=121292 RepID=UPI0028622931|nr:Wzz/FepE/Etk N-terminal domain-containing protein [Pseudarthrobacter sulfonivorans]MDR6414891.1 capsular polysaccharide biosynthesis protein [Pseudarthrobacter sulfonivorans]
MSDDLPGATVRLRELAAQVSRRWMILIFSMAVVTAAALGASTLVQKEYTAAASLAVAPLTTNPFSSAAVNQQINITTERAILASSEVARIASEELGPGAAAPHVLLKRVDVAAPSGSQVLEVSVTMPSPQEAADYANAMAGAYLRFRAEGASEVASGYVAALDKEIAKLSAIRSPTTQQAQRLSDAVQQRQNFVLVADSPGRIIGVASAPSEPSSVSQRSFLAAGLIGGFLMGVVAALLRERLDRRVRTLSRLSEACSGPAVKVVDKDDTEGIRWVLRSLTAVGAKASGPILVSTVPVVGKSPSPREFVDGLAAAARASGLSVLVVRPMDISPSKVDQGWPESALSSWNRLDLVILETDHRLRGARRARLADHLDAVLILAYAMSPLKDLRRLESELGGSTALRVPVLLGDRFNEEPLKKSEAGSLLTLPPSGRTEQHAAERKESA